MMECETHGLYDPSAYYTEGEIREMLDDAPDWNSGGEILCPLCLKEVTSDE
jgi:hypothetical protein